MRFQIQYFLFIYLMLGSCSYYPELDRNPKNVIVNETLKYIQIGEVDLATKALVMYPGGLVDPLAYTDLLSGLVSEKLVVFIVKFPSNLAVIDINAAKDLRKTFTEIDSWNMIGHSLGGAMACSEVGNNRDAYKNLILLGSYPGEGVDLTDFEGNVLSIYGSMDAFSTPEKVLDSKSQFRSAVEITDPSEINLQEYASYFYEIVGGNHSNFGSYGMQRGDGESTISTVVQQEIVRSFVKTLLDE